MAASLHEKEHVLHMHSVAIKSLVSVFTDAIYASWHACSQAQETSVACLNQIATRHSCMIAIEMYARHHCAEKYLCVSSLL